MDSEARAKAEARRQKILARQKDRLSAITGAYSNPQEPTSPADGAQQAPSGAQQAPSAAAPQEAIRSAVGQADAAQLQQQGQSHDRFEQQMAAVLSATAAHLQQAQAVAQDPNSQGQQQELLHSLLRSEITSAEADRQAAAETDSSIDSAIQQPPPQDTAQELPQQVAFLLKLGPMLLTAVRQTQLIRVLSAVLLAYAVLSGWEVGMPPALLVLLLDGLLVASAVVVLGSTSYGKRLAAAEAAAEAASKDVHLPMRLRSFDVLSLLPGFRQLLTVITGYRQFANALSEDVAVYIVGLGLFTVIISPIAA